jgi:hypothetical protein
MQPAGFLVYAAFFKSPRALAEGPMLVFQHPGRRQVNEKQRLLSAGCLCYTAERLPVVAAMNSLANSSQFPCYPHIHNF